MAHPALTLLMSVALILVASSCATLSDGAVASEELSLKAAAEVAAGASEHGPRIEPEALGMVIPIYPDTAIPGVVYQLDEGTYPLEYRDVAYLGRTSGDAEYHVIYVLRIIRGMLSPHGLAEVCILDEQYKMIGHIHSIYPGSVLRLRDMRFLIVGRSLTYDLTSPGDRSLITEASHPTLIAEDGERSAE